MAKIKKSKRFKYNLASALKVRNIRETLQKEEVNKAIRKLKEEEEKLKKIEEEQEAEHQKIMDMYEGKKSIDLDEINLRKYHLDVLKEKHDKQQEAVKQAEQNKIEQDKKLLQAVKDRKILEKDKEKKRKQWKKIMDKEDMKFLDDIAVSRFFRSTQVEEE